MKRNLVLTTILMAVLIGCSIFSSAPVAPVSAGALEPTAAFLPLVVNESSSTWSDGEVSVRVWDARRTEDGLVFFQWDMEGPTGGDNKVKLFTLPEGSECLRTLVLWSGELPLDFGASHFMEPDETLGIIRFYRDSQQVGPSWFVNQYGAWTLD